MDSTSQSQLALAVVRPVACVGCGKLRWAHLGVTEVGKGWPAVGLQLCGTTGEGTKIGCWLPAFRSHIPEENFKKLRSRLISSVREGREMWRVYDAVSRIIYK